MRVTFYGAGLEVTGSCFLVETESARVLIDCGQFQGSEKLERENVIPKGMNVPLLSAVLLTHGHLDHCGRLPLLVKVGYRGPIYATEGTIDVAKLILTDAARVQADDTERENRKRARLGQKPITPLFTQNDVERVFKLFNPVPYVERISVSADFHFRLVEAGHILGSASVELECTDEGRTKMVVFSGDVGPPHVPIMRDPAVIPYADAVFMESTYGDRDHRPLVETVAEFQEIMERGIELGGKILIPTFAIGRAQQMLYHLAELFRAGRLKPVPVFLDSPLAIAATDLYMRRRELMDPADSGIFYSSSLTEALPELQYCVSAEESRALNKFEGSCVILAGAGMCNAGRILHHLRLNLNDPRTAVVMVGYQARGSLGRLLLEGATPVRILGETVPVRATVRGLGGFSAHAGQSDLIGWLAKMAPGKPRIFLIHGEPHPMKELSSKIEQTYGVRPEMPRIRDSVTV